MGLKMTDLLQAVILRGPRVPVAVNGDLHGGCFAHDTVRHRRAVSATHHQEHTSTIGLKTASQCSGGAPEAFSLTCTDASAALLTAADVAGLGWDQTRQLHSPS